MNFSIITFFAFLIVFWKIQSNSRSNRHGSNIWILPRDSHTTPSCEKVAVVLVAVTLKYLYNIEFVIIVYHIRLVEGCTIYISVVLKNMIIFFSEWEVVIDRDFSFHNNSFNLLFFFFIISFFAFFRFNRFFINIYICANIFHILCRFTCFYLFILFIWRFFVF